MLLNYKFQLHLLKEKNFTLLKNTLKEQPNSNIGLEFCCDISQMYIDFMFVNDSNPLASFKFKNKIQIIKLVLT
jgi:hypothetical protein